MLGDVVRQKSLFGDDETGSSNRKKKGSDGWRGMYIEAWPDGPRHLVSGTRDKLTCNCGKNGCSHVSVAEDVLFGDGKKYGSRWVCKSGLHKELRRQDIPKAMAWSWWFRRFWGSGAPLNYMRKIWSEETCNIDMMEKLDRMSPRDTDKAIRLFCSSRKLWEFKEARSLYLMFGHAASRFGQGKAFGHLVGNREKSRAMLLDNSLEDAATMVISAKRNDEKGEELAFLRTELVNTVHDRGLLSSAQRDGFLRRFASGRVEDEESVLLLLHFGTHTKEMNEYRELPVSPEEEPYLPYPRSYVMDYHTSRGKASLANWIKATGKKLWFETDMGDLDYRFAGGSIPVYWRYCAWENFGTLDVPWDEVVLTDEQKRVGSMMDWWC